jgi:hypothetical protein
MSGPEPSPPATKLDWARRILAGLIFLALTGLVVWSYYAGGPQVCRNQLTSADEVVALCRPFGTDDVIAVGLILALVLLLLGPDLQEFGVGGLFNIKLRQRIAAVEKKADANATEVAYVALGSPVPSAARIQEAATRASAKPQPSKADREAARRVLSGERQELETRLSSFARELDVYVRALSDHPSNPADSVYQVARKFEVSNREARTLLLEIRGWGVTYRDELMEWAKLRNLFVHYPERLSDGEVSAAIGLADRLLAEARKIRALPEAYLSQSART